MFFSRKKKEPEKSSTAEDLPELPDLPEYKEEHLDFPNLPSYSGEELEPLEEEPSNKPLPKMDKSFDEELPKIEVPRLNLPKREKVMPRDIGAVKETPMFSQLPIEEEEAPIEPAFKPTPRFTSDEKPLFVKVDSYKNAINTIERIRERLKDADQVLNEVLRLKREEDHQIETWHSDLEQIKDKLLSIDKQLFEA